MIRCLNILFLLHLILPQTQSLIRRLDKYEKESFVVSLNFYRAAISNPTAANMNFLKWNTTLEEKAAFISHECYFFMEAPPGENYDIISEAVSAKNTFIISDFFESIYAYGKRFYNFTSKVHCKNLPGSYRMCHYFKMAFARYRSFGCNVAYCPHYGNRIRACLKSCISIVCLFSPSSRDNVFREYGHELMVQPYKEGPSCSQCFSNHGLCISKLCRSHPPCEEVPGCDKLMVSTCFCSIGCTLRPFRTFLSIWTILKLKLLF